MTMRGENLRFWLPVIGLVAFGVYTSQKLIRTHLSEVKAPDYYFERDLLARRGSIYSSLGRSSPLVVSVPNWEYRLDPVHLTNAVVKRKGEPRRPPLAIMRTISDALKMDYNLIKKKCSNTSNRYQFLKISSDPKTHEILANSRLVAGVSIKDLQVRDYLGGRSLCHVLGSVNNDHIGSAGIEQHYNKILTGTPGRIQGMLDGSRSRRELYDRRITSVDPIPGADIFLTINPTVQNWTEKALKWGIAKYEAAAGWAIVMNAKTGAIIAMASFPDFDPPTYGRIKNDDIKINRAIAYNYEPGSVMKVITAAAAIDSGRVTPNTRYRTHRDDDRYYRLPGDGSHAWEPTMTIRDAIVHSSNIVIGKLGCDIGPKTLWEYMKRFGFGSKTEVGLPGEQYGILPHWKKWDKVKWSRAPIGQGVSVTAIQLASAYQAIANDGVRMKPFIVERIANAQDEDVFRHKPKAIGRVISAATARTMREVMLGVATREGTARRAAIKGYTIAGKTGTAQKVINGHYAEGLYVATFCGIVPATNPELVVLTTLDFDRRTRYHQGGNSAGPVFRRIATAALRCLMITPDKPNELDGEEENDLLEEMLNDDAAPINTTN